MADNDSSSKLGWPAVWSLAAGGMVGGGIYIALGVVIAVAGQWAWLSFVIAGLAAATATHSYVRLANELEEGGGAFEYLRRIDHEGTAGSLSWVLIIGYVLTMAVYSFAFGHYLSYAFGAGVWTTRACAIGILAALVFLNLQGVGSTKKVEMVIVLGNLLALLALGAWGLAHWDPVKLVAGIEPRPWWTAVIGAAAIFMSYEGFQLLTYEYDEIRNPKKILKPTLITAVLFVIAVYALVAVGATMLAGALTIVEQKQVALAVAARDAAGLAGLVVMAVAAGFATAAAINSTLFSTAKLTERVADDGELPAWLDHRNDRGIPDRAVVFLGGLSALLAVTGSLSTLVEAASLAFLFTFSAINWIAWRRFGEARWIPLSGIALAVVIALVLTVRLAVIAPVPLAILVLFVALAVVGRPALLRRLPTEEPDGEGAGS